MTDNENFYIYNNGTYTLQNKSLLPLKRIIRDKYKLYFNLRNKIMFPDNIITNIPSPNKEFLSEVIDYIKAYRQVNRQEIDNEQHRYINFKNTLFDLEKWEPVPHTPQIRSIHQINAVYDQNAECPKTREYLQKCELSENDVNILIEFAGYCLSTDVSAQKALLLYGEGANGKSTFINMLTKILSDELVSGEGFQELEEDKYSVAELYGKTLNTFPDLKDNPIRTGGDVFRRITGNDRIRAVRKYEHPFYFYNTAKLLFSANNPPSISEVGGGYAFYRRWMLVKFPHKFEDNEKDDHLLEKLTTENEKSGFINLMIDGLKRVLEKGFSYKYSVQETQMIYECQSNNVKVFENLCLRNCYIGEEPTEKNELYEFYIIWCEINHLAPKKLPSFSKTMKYLERPAKETTIEGMKCRYYEDTCFDKLLLLNGDEVEAPQNEPDENMTLEEIEAFDGTKEKFEDKLTKKVNS